MTEQILGAYKTAVKSLELRPFADGRFEVYLNGEKIYSKHETGVFPEWEQLQPTFEKAAEA
ncbi:MAG TPA: Rdx family protein [Armatimonadota bacterium]|nr:Rdx family protein [Armatimonadota bacterium]